MECDIYAILLQTQATRKIFIMLCQSGMHLAGNRKKQQNDLLASEVLAVEDLLLGEE